MLKILKDEPSQINYKSLLGISYIASIIHELYVCHCSLVRMDVIGETHFHSHVRTDQRILDPKAIYNSVRELCNGCDRKPALQEFNKYREDNKDAMKFYTDPTYFFNLWVDDQRKHLRKVRTISPYIYRQ